MKSHSSSLMQEIAGVGGWSGGWLEWSRECWEEADMNNIITFLCDLMRWSQFQVKMKILNHIETKTTQAAVES